MKDLEKIQKQTTEENKTTYTGKEVTKLTNLSVDLLRVYEKEFNLDIQRTTGGHRRYTEENIELLIDIKKKIQDQNWSYKMVQQWLSGEEMTTESPEVRSNLEKKMENLEGMVQDLLSKSERDEQFQQALLLRLQEQAAAIENQNNYIKNSLEERDQKLLENIRRTQEEKKSRNWFQRLFKK